MIDPTLLGLYLFAAGAMILSPGPDTVYVLTRSVGEGRRVGLTSAAGIGVGVLVHTLAAVLGLAALLRASELAFVTVTYLGAAYLAFLGVRTIRDDGLAPDTSEGEAESRESSAGAASAETPPTNPFAEAVAVNVLNPQVALFFLAFLPQFVEGAWIELQLTLLGAIYAALTVAYLGTVALAASALRQMLAARPGVADGIRWVTGLALIGLALRSFLLGP